jgi:hypothetical protein
LFVSSIASSFFLGSPPHFADPGISAAEAIIDDDKDYDGGAILPFIFAVVRRKTGTVARQVKAFRKCGSHQSKDAAPAH